MKFDRDRAVSILLSLVYPGAGHLYAGRYIMGATGVVLATWAVIALLVVHLLLNPHAGLGPVLYPVCTYVLAAIWAAMLGSLLAQDLRLRRIRGDRAALFAQAYAAYLRGETAASLAVFAGMPGPARETTAAAVMAARCQARLGRPRRARAILKRARRQAAAPLWQWEIDRNLAELAGPADPA